MDILGRPIKDIQARMVGQTNYRINVVKGIVANRNINDTFGCYIAGETVIYPNIPTFSRKPKLEIGDEVTIEFINGCREMPVILAPEDIRERPDTTLPMANVFVAYHNFVTVKWYINKYDSDGVYVTQWEIESSELYYGDNVLCVDANENIYTITGNDHSIKKRNSEGVLVLTKTETDFIYNIAVGPDGYIYTVQYDSAFNDGYIAKRNASDLVVVDSIVIDAGGGLGVAWDGFAIDSDGNFYLTNSVDDRYEKWTWLGGRIATRNSTSSIRDGGLGIAGTKLGSVDAAGRHPITIPLALNENETDGVLDDITKPEKIGTIAGYLLYSGRGTTADRWIGKFDSNLTKIWTTLIPGSSGFGIVSIGGYPF